MAQTVTITLVIAGLDTGPFDLYSDADGYVTPFETGVLKALLVAGYTSVLVPDAATVIRVASLGVCTNFVDLPIDVVPPTTTTTTTFSTTTTTTTSYCQSIGAGTGCYNWNVTAGLSGAVVQVVNCFGVNTSVVLNASETGSLCACDGVTPIVVSGSATLTQVGSC